MASDRIVEVSGDSFQQDVLEAELPVLVDFWAEWCGPCKMLAPVLEELAGELDGKVKIAKVDVDQFPEVAQQHGVQGLPTLVLFKDGAAAERIVGAHPKPKLTDFIQQNT